MFKYNHFTCVAGRNIAIQYDRRCHLSLLSPYINSITICRQLTFVAILVHTAIQVGHPTED